MHAKNYNQGEMFLPDIPTNKAKTRCTQILSFQGHLNLNFFLAHMHIKNVHVFQIFYYINTQINALAANAAECQIDAANCFNKCGTESTNLSEN